MHWCHDNKFRFRNYIYYNGTFNTDRKIIQLSESNLVKMLSLIEVNGKKKLKLCTRVQRNKEKAIDLNESFSIGLLNIKYLY